MKNFLRPLIRVLPLIAILCGVLLFADASLAGEATSTFELFPDEATGFADFRVYLVNFYKFAIPASILVATVLIMIGGVIWITSAGSQKRIEKAKEFIINSIIGVILLVSAYLVLAFINPNLVNLQLPPLDKLAAPGACFSAVPNTGECEGGGVIINRQDYSGTSSECCRSVFTPEQCKPPGKFTKDRFCEDLAAEQERGGGKLVKCDLYGLGYSFEEPVANAKCKGFCKQKGCLATPVTFSSRRINDKEIVCQTAAAVEARLARINTQNATKPKWVNLRVRVVSGTCYEEYVQNETWLCKCSDGAAPTSAPAATPLPSH